MIMTKNMDEDLLQYVTRLETLTEDVELYRFNVKISNVGLDKLLGMGWCIISTWIEPEFVALKCDMCVSNVSFRFGKSNARLIVTADVYIPEAGDALLNMDSDEPGSVVELVPSTSTEMWKLRLISMVGYGSCSNGRPGLSKPMTLPKLTIAGLDIEVSTYERKGGMPLPHDPIISIVISNGAWYDKTQMDVCVCIYTFGFVAKDLVVDGRSPTLIKANSSEHAVLIAYTTLDKLGYDFINVHNAFNFDLKHLAVKVAEVDGVADLFEKKRLGNFGSGMFMKLTNGCMFVDSMYTAMKTSRPGEWPSFGLANMAAKLDLPPKMDVDGMMIQPSDDYDLTDMIGYNCRDSDLHAWLAKTLSMCEHLCTYAGLGKACIQDAIANNVGMMVFCMQQSVCLSAGMCLDLSPTMGSDERKFEGGLVLEPDPGIYKGVIMIDGNSLYGTIMSKLGIFVDRCASSATVKGLSERLSVHIPKSAESMKVDSMVTTESVIVMRTKSTYLGIKRGGPTVLSTIIDMLISTRKSARESGNSTLAAGCKLYTTSLFGTTGSPHGVVSSKTCAEIITYAARYYLRRMIEITTWCGYKVVYGDTDSIFVHVKSETESGCMAAGLRIKSNISRYTKGTVFEQVGADIKGNYRSIAISSKKKYEGVFWDGSLDTKGLAPVKKDTLPIVRYVMKKVLDIINSDVDMERKRLTLTNFIGGVMLSVQNEDLPKRSMVIEKRINCQPHLVYKDANGKTQSILIDIGEQITSVSKRWVVERITSAVDGLIVAMNMSKVSEMVFICESMRLRRKALGTV